MGADAPAAAAALAGRAARRAPGSRCRCRATSAPRRTSLVRELLDRVPLARCGRTARGRRGARAGGYAELLAGAGADVDVWETTYLHRLTGPDPVLEWISGTALRPVRDALRADDYAGVPRRARARGCAPPTHLARTAAPGSRSAASSPSRTPADSYGARTRHASGRRPHGAPSGEVSVRNVGSRLASRSLHAQTRPHDRRRRPRRDPRRWPATCGAATARTTASCAPSPAAEALDALRELKLRGEPVAAILADYRMPEMNGIEFLEQAMDLVPHARRALLTAYADTDAAIQAINVVDVDHYLLKPWDPPEEKLYPVIDALIETWRGSRRPAVEEIRVRRAPLVGRVASRPATSWPATRCPTAVLHRSTTRRAAGCSRRRAPARTTSRW